MEGLRFQVSDQSKIWVTRYSEMQCQNEINFAGETSCQTVKTSKSMPLRRNLQKSLFNLGPSIKDVRTVGGRGFWICRQMRTREEGGSGLWGHPQEVFGRKTRSSKTIGKPPFEQTTSLGWLRIYLNIFFRLPNSCFKTDHKGSALSKTDSFVLGYFCFTRCF